MLDVWKQNGKINYWWLLKPLHVHSACLPLGLYVLSEALLWEITPFFSCCLCLVFHPSCMCYCVHIAFLIMYTAELHNINIFYQHIVGVVFLWTTKYHFWVLVLQHYLCKCYYSSVLVYKVSYMDYKGNVNEIPCDYYAAEMIMKYSLMCHPYFCRYRQ